MISKIWTTLLRFITFIKTGVWRISLKDISRMRSFFITLLRTVLLAIRGFREDNCMLRASSLTFYTLLSIVPVVAMAFGMAKGFGFESLLEKQLFERFPGHEQVVTQVLNFAQVLLDNTKGEMIAGIGVILLLWSVLKLLGQIESSFNEIWEIRTARSVVRKFSNYISIMMIGPVFIVISSSVPIFVTSEILNITENVSLLLVFSPIIMGSLKILPYCLIGVLLTIIYLLMPNTRVHIKSAIVAGIIAGGTYVFVQWVYINFQVGIARNNAIYGSFAALPLLLLWLQLSWLIVLFGAEISFAIQNVDTFEFEHDSLEISPAFKKLLSLQVAHLLIKAFFKGDRPLTLLQISNRLEIPIRLLHQIMHELVDAGVLSEISHDEFEDPAYQPARDVNLLSVSAVIQLLEQRGSDGIPVVQSSELQVLSDTLQTFEDIIEQSPANKLLKDIGS